MTKTLKAFDEPQKKKKPLPPGMIYFVVKKVVA